MTRQIDDNLLLGYIEDELTPEEAARVRTALAADPELAEQVEQMREHRGLLCEEPEPPVPADLLSGIETRLARPLLIDPASSDGADRAALLSDARAAHRPHRSLRRRLAPMALAAMLMLALLAGVWTALTIWPGGTVPGGTPGANEAAPSPGPVVQATPEDSEPRAHHEAANDREPQSREASRPGGTLTVETGRPIVEPSAIQPGVETVGSVEPASAHAEPETDLANESAMTNDGPPPPPQEPAANPLAGDRFVMETMLIVSGADQSRIEQSLVEAAERLQRASLVQNFRIDTARQLEQLWMRAASEQRLAERDDQLLREVVDPARNFNLLAERVQQQVAKARHDGERLDDALAPNAVNGQLAGSHVAAPSLARQLAFASGGASHTLTAPVEDIESVLSQLAVEHGFETTFISFSERPDAGMDEDAADHSHDDGGFWAEHLRETRLLLERYRRLDPRGLIHLPIRIESGGS